MKESVAAYDEADKERRETLMGQSFESKSMNLDNSSLNSEMNIIPGKLSEGWFTKKGV